MNNIILITLTNFGYKDLTLNLVKSLENLKLNILIYCADKLSFEYFKDYNSKLIDSEINYSKWNYFV